MDGCDRSGGGGFDDGCARANTGDVGLVVAAGIFIDGLVDVVAESREQSELDRHDHRDGMPRRERPDERIVADRFVNNRYDRHTRKCIRFLHSA